MTKGTIQERLALSLDKANLREDKGHKAPVAIQATAKCTKISVSLFASDLTRLDAIVAYMAARGHRISTSQAIKLALRTAPLTQDLLAALDQVKAEDGRKW